MLSWQPGVRLAPSITNCNAMMENDNAQSNDEATSSPSSTGVFVLGTCVPEDGRVEFAEFKNKREAIRSFKEVSKSRRKSKRKSAVLLDSTATSQKQLMVKSQHFEDVAAILEAMEQVQESEENDETEKEPSSSTTSASVDRSAVRQKVEEGDAPMVPPSRTCIHQWLLKRMIDLFFHRPTVSFFSAGPHRMASLCYFNVRQHEGVRGHVALTLDDAPSRFAGNSQLNAIQQLLRQYNAKATFFVVGKFIPGHEEQLVSFLQDGHDLGNHGKLDQAHDNWANYDETKFLEAVDDCSNQIRDLQRRAGCSVQGVRYFRSPHGKYTRRMESLIHSRGMINVMCDAYAADPIIEDGVYIAKTLIRQARHGGIILLHIPEEGFRDYCMVALRNLLEGLQRRKLKVVSVSMLEELANSKPGSNSS